MVSETTRLVVSDCDDIALARRLFTEYLEATIEETGLPNPEQSPGVLEAMRSDIETLPGPYVAPDGALLVARLGDAPAGSVGLARLDETTAELRRLWVRAGYRRGGVARALAVASLVRAAELGYERVVLDVVPTRTGAIDLYRSLGFSEIEPYDEYPFPMVFLARKVP
jgi:ribosomal protein S18 acetylase RimI-like enzyme